MGLNLLISSSTYDTINNKDKELITPIAPHNPDPLKFTILRYYRIYKHLVVEIQYHGCTNYEGKKILVYKNTSINDLKNQGSIDPHFSDNKNYISPFARFEPTPEGLHIAVAMILKLMNDEENN